MWLDNLKIMKDKSGMTTKEISRESGIPEPTLEKLFAGVTKDPKLATMQQLVHFFGYTLDDLDDDRHGIKNVSGKAEIYINELSEKDKTNIKKYRSLDPYGQEAVDNVLDVEWRRCKEEEDKKKKIDEVKKQREKMEAAEEMVYFITPGFLSPMSAGTGQPAGSEYPENYRLIKEPPRGTSYIAPISGDSMEPTFHEGDKLFIRACTEINTGQIGVFFMDGQQWVKELGDGVLLSHNPSYPPRTITEDARCQGLVLGVCDESYFV